MTPADTSFQSVMLWVAALSMLVSLGTALWNIFSGPSKKNGASIAEMSARIGIDRARDWVHSELDWMAEIGAVKLTKPGSVVVAMLTEKGARHLRRAIVIEGIKRPSRPGE